MNLHFKENRYNWGDSFYVLDEDNQRKYRVRSSILLWNRKWEVRDLDKNLLILIKKEPRSLLKKKYHVLVNDEEIATVTKELSLIPKFTIEGLNWEIQSPALNTNALLTGEYRILEAGREILNFQIESTDWGLRPVLHIESDADELRALAVAMTISYVMTAKEGQSSTNHL